MKQWVPWISVLIPRPPTCNWNIHTEQLFTYTLYHDRDQIIRIKFMHDFNLLASAWVAFYRIAVSLGGWDVCLQSTVTAQHCIACRKVSFAFHLEVTVHLFNILTFLHANFFWRRKTKYPVQHFVCFQCFHFHFMIIQRHNVVLQTLIKWAEM